MKTKEINIKYQPWLSAEIMHNDSLKWLSELNFIKDEQLFFDDLVKSYTLQLIDSSHFSESKKIVARLSDSQRETETLLKEVLKHEKELKVMVDGKDQLEKEDAYKNEHVELITKVTRFTENYRMLKSQLFELVKNIIKEGKQRRLLQ
ncbi:hypothetical protein [Flavisericum labens]|uniref:hypothetical protein n=1 Tax=Flavisericum labens TaxID=3377112 RepID=UPI00387A8D4D